jgi:hypothetical protein
VDDSGFIILTAVLGKFAGSALTANLSASTGKKV